MIKCIFVFLSLLLPILVVGQNIKDSVNTTPSAKDQKFEKEIFVPVDVVPEFPGGDKKRMKFIKKNLKYPLSAETNRVQGTVYIQFIIEPDGSITNVRIKKDIGHGCGEEAARIVKLMPKWKPAMQGGKPVRCEFALPVRFVLN